MKMQIVSHIRKCTMTEETAECITAVIHREDAALPGGVLHQAEGD